MEIADVVGLAGVPVILGLVEVFKLWAPEQKRVYPVVAIGFGLAVNVGLAWSAIGDLRLAVLYGLVAGLAASGLYSGAKAVVGK